MGIASVRRGKLGISKVSKDTWVGGEREEGRRERRGCEMGNGGEKEGANTPNTKNLRTLTGW